MKFAVRGSAGGKDGGRVRGAERAAAAMVEAPPGLCGKDKSGVGVPDNSPTGGGGVRPLAAGKRLLAASTPPPPRQKK